VAGVVAVDGNVGFVSGGKAGGATGVTGTATGAGALG